MKPLNLTRATSKWRSQLRNLLWWVWPSLPTSWAQVPARLRPGSVQIARLTVAAVISYIIADALSPGLLDLTAPLTALLVVQASTVGTLQMGLVRVGAVLTGVLVAVGVASFIGLSWWSLAIVIATSLALAKVLRLGEQSLEAPISSMLILAVSSPDLAAEVRVVNTLIGPGGVPRMDTAHGSVGHLEAIRRSLLWCAQSSAAVRSTHPTSQPTATGEPRSGCQAATSFPSAAGLGRPVRGQAPDHARLGPCIGPTVGAAAVPARSLTSGLPPVRAPGLDRRVVTVA